jgi:signal-transduction protein with cAMP-binding, CBS, and nucleotidyltransferase domain
MSEEKGFKVKMKIEGPIPEGVEGKALEVQIDGELILGIIEKLMQRVVVSDDTGNQIAHAIAYLAAGKLCLNGALDWQVKGLMDMAKALAEEFESPYEAAAEATPEGNA